MKYIYLLVLSCTVHASCAQQLIRTWGGPEADKANGCALAADGSVYVAGSFKGSVDLDPGPGTALRTANGEDGFVSKFDATGQLVWALQFGGPEFDICTDVKVDGAGNVLVAGYFRDMIDLDPGPGTNTVSTIGTGEFDSDGFIVKLDPAGTVLWDAQIGGGTSMIVTRLAIGPNDAILATGQFYGTVDMDPSTATYPLTGMGCAYYVHLSTAGTFVSAGNLGDGATGNAIAVDAQGNIFLSSTLYGTADMDPGPGVANLTCLASRSLYVCKLDAAGNYQWAHAMGGEGLGVRGDMAVDAAGAVYTTAWFEGSSDFDPGPGTDVLISMGVGAYQGDAFVHKLDAAGQHQWVAQLGGPSAVSGAVIHVAPNGNIYTAGTYGGDVDMDPGPGTQLLTGPSTSSDSFISVLTPNGAFVDAFHLSGTELEYVRSMAVRPNGTPVLAGYFSGTADLDPGPGVGTAVSNGDQDAFVLLGPSGAIGIAEAQPLAHLRSYPNPAMDRVVLDTPSGTGMLVVHAVDGRRIYEARIAGTRTVIDLNTWPSGVYAAHIETEGARTAAGRIVKGR